MDETGQKDRLLNLAVGVLTLCALVVTGLVVRRELASEPARVAEQPEVVPEWRAFAAGGHRMGPADAPVTIVEFSDFQCPFCRVLADRLRTIRERYPEQVAMVYRHYPLQIHPFALPAVRASECAAAQGRFAAFHDALFARQDSLGIVPWTRFATAAEVPDTAAFRRCADESGAIPALARDTLAGSRLNVTGTPTLLINNVRFGGVPPLDTLDAYVKAALSGLAAGAAAAGSR